MSVFLRHRLTYAVGALALLWFLAFAGNFPASRKPPARLSETGLYSDILSKTVEASNVPYAPQYPLWSDGARKKRWIALPRGQSIDGRHVDNWEFPVGTRFWKEFSFGRRVETRYMEKTGKSTWVYATYAWNADESEAVLVPESGLRDHAEIVPGIRHNLPGLADCKACHEGQGRDVVLGFNALQLSPDRDPNAPHAEPRSADMATVQSLVDQKLLSHFPERFLRNPPVIAAASSTERAALGYLSANCGNCHNASDPLSSVGMFLRRLVGSTPKQEADAMASVVGHPSKYRIPGTDGKGSFRVCAGDTSRSSLVDRMNTRNPYRQMPPLGTKIVDTEAVALITKWIQEDLVTNRGEDRTTNH